MKRDRPRRCARSGYAYSSRMPRSSQTSSGTRSCCARRFTLGGAGGGIAYNDRRAARDRAPGPRALPAGEVLVEESIGWKEYEMEVMRDRAGNGIIVCSIENFDAMGVHTGDSITVAPAQTLTDVEYQRMRDGLAGHPGEDRRRDRRLQRAVRRQPRERAHDRHRDEPARVPLSALASKATGFPIAKAAARWPWATRSTRS
jgi:carbamoyl-phosphate synthase large subunit